MKTYVVKKILTLFPILLTISFLTFSLTYIAPSDPVTLKYSRWGLEPDPEVVEKEKTEMGLNDPFLVQYTRWVSKAITGDFGESYKYKEPVITTIMKRLPNTLILTCLSMLMTLVIAVPLGILIAARRNKFLDYIIRLFSFLGISMPSFWVGTIFMYVFGIYFKWFPVLGSSKPIHFVLPVATLTFWLVSIYIRRIRTSILEEFNKDYVVGAQALGLSKWHIMITQVIPNALLSILPTIGMSVGGLLGGAIMVEAIFEFHGIGMLAVTAIDVKDYPLIQGYVIFMAIIYVFINLIVDILSWYIDPRIRFGGDK